MSHASIDRMTDELKEILDILEDNLHDLQEWSVYNDDQFSDEIVAIGNALEAIK